MKHSAILRYSILLICLFGLRTSYAANEKSIRLTASLGEFHDAEKTVGFLSTATDAYDDSIDVPEPPLPPEGYVLLSVEPMTGAPEWFTRFRTDYRSNTINLGQELQTWSLLLESDHTGLVEISTTIGSQIDTVSEVYVFDDSSFWNLRDSTLVHLNFVAGQPHALTIAVGTPSETQIDLSPLAGDSVYSIGGHKTLNWNVDSEIGVNQTKIEVSYNNGSTFTTLMEVDSLATTFEWDIPQATTSEGILRISAIDLLGRSIAEEHTFQIIDDSNYLQGVVILAPQAGQSVTSGTAEPVFWDYVGGVENVTGAIVDYLLPGEVFSRLLQ